MKTISTLGLSALLLGTCLSAANAETFRWAGTTDPQTMDPHAVNSAPVLGFLNNVYEGLVLPRARPHPSVRLVVFRAADGYRVSLPLEDLLADDVLLASGLGGVPLDLAHGTPLRLVAPAHYGYKNCKHLAALEFWRDARHYRFPRPYPRFMDHPRARVALEERARWLPAPLVRAFYRLLVGPTVRRFAAALERQRRRRGEPADGE